MVSVAEGRVEPVEGFPQEFTVEVGIDLGGGYAFMAEHFLDGAEVGAAFYEVSGKGMPEGMGGNIFGDAGLADQVFQEEEDHDPREPAAAAVEEEDIFMTRLDRDVDADLLLVDPNVFDGGGPDWHQPFLVPLADYPDIAYVQVKTGDPEVNDFADAEAATVHRFKDGLISPSFRFTEVDPADDGLYLVEAEYIGEGPF